MNHSDLNRNAYMLRGSLSKHGYMRWWHSFQGTCTDTGDVRTFFIEYFIMNPGLGTDAPILGQHPYYKKRGIKPSYVMINAGVFPKEGCYQEDALPEGNRIDSCIYGKQLHRFFPVSSLIVAKDPLYIQIENCLYSENRIMGSLQVSKESASHRSLMTDAGYMEWDLAVHKSISHHTGVIASPFFCAINALDSFWHGEGIRTAYSGHVLLDGLSYEICPETSYGYADKHWGRNYNKPWLQLASSHLISKRTGKVLKYSALAVNGCCPRLFIFPLRPRINMQLTYTGEDFSFNFAQPGRFSRSKWKCRETNKRFIWHIKAQNKKVFVRLSMSSKKEAMLPLDYETPDGIKRKEPLYASGNALGTIELYRTTPQGNEWVDTLIIEDGLSIYQRYE